MIANAAGESSVMSRSLRQNPLQSHKGNAQPVGAVRKLVVDFVERLFYEEKIEQAGGIAAVGRPQQRGRQGLAVGGHEGTDRLLTPILQRVEQPVTFVRPRFQRSFERGRGSVVDGTQEAGDIA